MNIRAAVLAVPVTAAFAVASASAATVTLSPLGPAHHAIVGALGATCAVPYAPALATEPLVQYPAVARMLGVEGVATVGISLSPSGRLIRAWPIQSTGNRLLDAAAMDAAQDTRYAAERAECNAVGGNYKIEVDFSLDG